MALCRFLDEQEKVDIGMAKSHELWVKHSLADWLSVVIKAIHNGASPGDKVVPDLWPQEGQNSSTLWDVGIWALLCFWLPLPHSFIQSCFGGAGV